MDLQAPPLSEASASDVPRNAVLRSIPQDQWEAWAPHMETVRLRAGQPVYQTGQPIWYVHFPLTCVISIEAVLSDGSGTQVALIGHEGLVGIPALFGGTSTTIRAAVQCPGTALRMPASVLQTDFSRGGPFTRLVQQRLQMLVEQSAQTAACQRHHSPMAQLCCLLLRISDSAASDTLLITHEQLGHLLGVRRETITQAAHKLQETGLLQYRRGHLHILERKAMEQRACECYQAVKQMFDKLVQQRSD